MIRIRRRIAAPVSIAVMAALCVVTLGYSTAAAHTTTIALLPTGAGSYTAWGPNTGQSEFTLLNESGSASCNPAGNFVSTSTANSRESVAVSLASIPDGSVITEVVVQAFHRSEGSSPSLLNGTFRSFARFNGTDTDASTDIVSSSAGNTCTQADRTINVADTAKDSSTTLEIGVVKTATNNNTVRVGALRAIVTYNQIPTAPTGLTPTDGSSTTDTTPTFDWADGTDPDAADTSFTYDFGIAPFASSTCGTYTTTAGLISSDFTPIDRIIPGTYCWRVRTLDHSGLQSAWTTQTVTIAKTDVTAVITAADKPYDGSTDANYTCAVAGITPGDTVSCDGDHPASFDNANAGSAKTVTATNLSISDDDAIFYNLPITTATDTADINQVVLSVNAGTASKTYGAADPEPLLTPSLSGFIPGEDATNVTITGSASCTRDTGEVVGTYVITCAPGALASTNYSFQVGSTGTFAINKATLSVDADDASKTYGDADPGTFTYSFSGFVNGDTPSGVTVTGSPTCSRAPGETVSGSPYAITCDPNDLSSDNYEFTSGDSGDFTINKRDVSAQITTADKVYDGTTAATYTCDLQGVLSPDVVTCAGDPATFDDADAGIRTATATGLALGGDSAGNYNLPLTTATDSAEITQAPLTVDAVDASKQAGESDPALSATLSGFVNGEDGTSAGVTGGAACSRESGETPGTYAITCLPGDLSAANYSFATGNAGTFTIHPDTTAPSVTINQAPSQVDPTRTAPIAYDVTFSEPVTGFDDSDVLLTGTAGATTASVSGSGTAYSVSVSGMTVTGTVIASVTDAAATDAAGNPSTASTSTDNVVTFRGKGKPPAVVDIVGPSSTYAGRSIPVKVKGLTSGESYTIKIDDQTVSTGTADTKGKANTKVTVPLSVQPGTHALSVTGATADRNDTDELLILSPLELIIDLKSSVEAGDQQKVTVSNLLPGEEVEIRLDGVLTDDDPVIADAKGKYRLTFTSSTPGTHEVEATGLYDGRTTTTTFTVVEAAESAAANTERKTTPNKTKNVPSEGSQPDSTGDTPAATPSVEPTPDATGEPSEDVPANE